MEFLKNLFTKKETKTMKSWNHITDENQLEEIIANSSETPSVIFKHSVTCGISAHAKDKLETAWNFNEDELKFYYLDLLAYRAISNKIAELFSVTHQSPQILIIKDGKATAHFSHQAISVDRIKKEL